MNFVLIIGSEDQIEPDFGRFLAIYSMLATNISFPNGPLD